MLRYIFDCFRFTSACWPVQTTAEVIEHCQVQGLVHAFCQRRDDQALSIWQELIAIDSCYVENFGIESGLRIHRCQWCCFGRWFGRRKISVLVYYIVTSILSQFVLLFPGVIHGSGAIVYVFYLDLLQEVLCVLVALSVECSQLVTAMNPINDEVLDLDSLMVTHLFFNPFNQRVIRLNDLFEKPVKFFSH